MSKKFHKKFNHKTSEMITNITFKNTEEIQDFLEYLKNKNILKKLKFAFLGKIDEGEIKITFISSKENGNIDILKAMEEYYETKKNKDTKCKSKI